MTFFQAPSSLQVKLHHCKKLEVDLTLKRSSQLQSGFIQVQVVVHLLLQGFSVTTLVH